MNFDKWLQSQRHRVILSNGERAGFFIGDAAGVGKGRQVSRKLSCSDGCILFINCWALLATSGVAKHVTPHRRIIIGRNIPQSFASNLSITIWVLGV